MFSIEQIKNGPNPEIPQWRVTDQDRSLTLSVKILKSNARAWNLYAERWGQNTWTLIERIGETTEPGAASCEAGAWLAEATRKPVPPADTFVEDHWR